MLSKYYEQLKQLYNLLRNGRGMDFGFWKETMALTFLIIMQTLGFIIALALMFVAPIIAKIKLKAYFNQKMHKAENTVAGDRVSRQYFMATILYWVCLLVIYVPFAIPTLLLLL